jgi:hypothetical protein
MFCGIGHGQGRSDTSIRQVVELPIPTKLKVHRTRNQLSDSFDLDSLRNVRIIVDKDMFIGLKDEIRVYQRGDPRPEKAGRVSYASIDEHAISSEPGFLKSTNLWNRFPDGIPVPGKQYSIEHDIAIFETSVPPQHLWHIESGGRYRVLWDRKLSADSR